MRIARPSRTARKVALNVVSLGSRRGMEDVLPSGIVDATARLLVESGAVGPGAVRFCRTRAAVGIYLAFDWMMPGQFEAFGHRKAFCERQVRQGIEGGARQVLALGAGYDTLGWRLAPEFPDVKFFEIDHPATAGPKARGIEAMGPRRNLHLLAEDLGERQLGDVLSADSTWEVTARTVVIAEGLLMYLRPEAVGALFEQCATVTGAGSRVAFTYLGRRSDGRPEAGPWTAVLVWLLKAAGEEWHWSIDPAELGPFLELHGWTIAGNPGESPTKRGIEFFGLADRRRTRRAG